MKCAEPYCFAEVYTFPDRSSERVKHGRWIKLRGKPQFQCSVVKCSSKPNEKGLCYYHFKLAEGLMESERHYRSFTSKPYKGGTGDGRRRGKERGEEVGSY